MSRRPSGKRPADLPVPPALVERARLLAAGRLEPVAARPASTVLLLRDSPAGPQVYLLRRRTTMAFAAGMYAFPGGSVDARDADAAAALAWTGPAPAEWASRLGFDTEPAARASVCAAARELFEETGVLLAGRTPVTVVPDTTGAEYEDDRMAMVGRALSFAEFLTRRDLILRSDLLEACAHWVTPEAEVRRYDTRFYLAALPAGQHTRDVSGEADRVAWLRPVDAAVAVDAGEMEMLPPTAATLAALESAGSVAEAFAAARHRSIRRILPSVGVDRDRGWWVIPGEGG